MEIVMDDSMCQKAETFLNVLNKRIETPEELAYQHFIKAEALRMQNFFWEAIAEYLEVLKYQTDKPEVHKGLGYAYKQTGFTKSAVEAFNQAKKLTPFDKELYFEVGCCSCMDKKFPKAIKEFKKAIKLCPDYQEAKLNMGLAYELGGNGEQALKLYQDIIAKHPENVAAYNAYGSLNIKLENYSRAIKIFRELLKFDRRYARAYLGIAIAFDKLQKPSYSIRYYKKYVELKPNCSNVPFIQDRLKALRNAKISARASHIQLVS